MISKELVALFRDHPCNPGWKFREIERAPQARHYRGPRPAFEQAREFARSLGLKSEEQWREYVASGKKPVEIPFNPSYYYKGKGWISWTDWLKNPFLDFESARAFARTTGLKTRQEWMDYCASGKKPENIPSSPWTEYEAWVSMPDWLGPKKNDVVFRPFEEAREYARSLGFRSMAEWQKHTKSPDFPTDIPKHPGTSRAYRGQWRGLEDWLGGLRRRVSRNPRRKLQEIEWLDFESARSHVRAAGIRNRVAWTAWAKTNQCPRNIPSNPSKVYRDKWNGWRDWLGGNRPSRALVRA